MEALRGMRERRGDEGGDGRKDEEKEEGRRRWRKEEEKERGKEEGRVCSCGPSIQIRPAKYEVALGDRY